MVDSKREKLTYMAQDFALKMREMDIKQFKVNTGTGNFRAEFKCKITEVK